MIVRLGAITFAWMLLASADFAQAQDCRDTVTTEPLSAGLSRLRIAAPCRKAEKVKIRYAATEFVRVLDSNGELDFTLDCYLGEAPGVMVSFKDGSRTSPPLKTIDTDRVTKIAVTWKGAVNLDLHAFEYAASLSDSGHVWEANPSSRWDVEAKMRRDKRGYGFISFGSDGSAEGDQLEVYTFVHEAGQISGTVRLALDYESRARRPQDPDTCGMGLYADVEYKVTVVHAKGRITQSRGSFPTLECNTVLDQVARYNPKTIPQLFLTR